MSPPPDTTAGVLINTAVTSLASRAAVSLINNGGDLGATLKELERTRQQGQPAAPGDIARDG